MRVVHLGSDIISRAPLERSNWRVHWWRYSYRLDGGRQFHDDSDFKWVLPAMALVWAFSLGLFWYEKK